MISTYKWGVAKHSNLGEFSLHMINFIRRFFQLCWTFITFSVFAQPATLDNRFEIDSGFDGAIGSISRDIDQSMVVAGGFTQYKGEPAQRIIRLAQNGAKISSFNPPPPNQPVNSVKIRANGSIVIGGNFTALGDTAQKYISVLKTNGELDESFDQGTGFNHIVRSVTEDSMGRILAAGDFTQYNGQPVSYVARLLPNGQLDPTFNVTENPNGIVRTVHIHSDGKILIGGDFTKVGQNIKRYLVRLNSDGSLDTSFDLGSGPNGLVRSIHLESNGNILIGGNFTSWNGVANHYFARLFSNGTLDTSFNAQVNGTVITVAQQFDGKLIIGGEFTTVGGLQISRVARLLPSGAIDPVFNSNVGFDGTVWYVNVLPNGGIICAGNFSNYQNQHAPRMAILQGLSSSVGGDLEFTEDRYEVLESQPSILLTVRRTGNISRQVSVDFETVNHTANAGDYVPSSGTLNFVSGQGTAIIQVALRSDERAEGQESFSVRLFNPTNEALLGSIPESTVIIKDNTSKVDAGKADLNLYEGPTNGYVQRLKTDPRGNILVGGHFTIIDSKNLNHLARLNPLGKVDDQFFTSAYANRAVNAYAIQNNGNILIAGDFTEINGSNKKYIARLLSNGRLDHSFLNIPGPNNSVSDIGLNDRGDIWIGGSFTSIQGQTRNYLARLFIDGSIDLDTKLGSGGNGVVWTIEVLEDQRVIIGGDFTKWDGVTRNRLARLNPDGSLDESFNIGDGFNGRVSRVLVLPSGKIMVAGAFSVINGLNQGYLVRLNSDGSLDTSFNARANSTVEALDLQLDGKLVVGGSFTQIGNGESNRLARLLEDGSLDPVFNVGTGANGHVRDLAALSDGRVIIGGQFTEYDGLPQTYLAMIDGLQNAVMGELQFTTSKQTVRESEGKVTIEVERMGNNTQMIQVDYSTVNDSANAGDYTPASGTLEFQPGVDIQTIEIAIRNDTSSENNEQFHINLSNPSTGAALSSIRETTVTILDDDIIEGAGQLAVNILMGATNGKLHDLDSDQLQRTLVVGEFTQFEGENRNRIARIDSSGNIDDSFKPYANNSIFDVHVLQGNRLLIGGAFTVVNGKGRKYLAALREDGTLDENFLKDGSGANSNVRTIAVSQDGGIWIGGNFTQYQGVSRPYISKLFADGALNEETQLGAGFNNIVEIIQPITSGGLFVGGAFTKVDNIERKYIVKLHDDGSLDDSFNTGLGPNSSVYDLHILPDGKLLIGGAFSQFNGLAQPYVARLNPDGSYDSSFVGKANGSVRCLAPLTNGAFYMGGEFTQVGGESYPRLARLLSSGLVDRTFDPGKGANSTVRALLPQFDGRLMIGGDFTSYNELDRSRIAMVEGLSVASGGELVFSNPHYEAFENDGVVTIEVARNGVNSSIVEVEFLTTNGTANAGDYTPQIGQLVFGPGESVKSFDIPLRNDDRVEGDETVILSLDLPTNGAIIGGQSEAVLTIRNDDFHTTPGRIDLRFVSGNSSGKVRAMDTASDGSLFVVGDFTQIQGEPFNRMANLNMNGSIRPGFGSATTVNGAIETVYAYEDGRILLGGNFTQAKGQPWNRMVRFLPDGRLDRTFVHSGGANGVIWSFQQQSNGDILAAGNFTNIQGISMNRYARLFVDGTVDPDFYIGSGANKQVYTIKQTPDQGILLAGDFTQIDGEPRKYLAKLDRDGKLVSNFNDGEGPNGWIRPLELMPDGNMLIGGNFTTINGEAVTYLAKLNENGFLDPEFRAELNGAVQTIAVQEDGKILIGGSFTSVSGQPRTRIARLNNDGTLDTDYDTGEGADNTVTQILLGNNGDVFVCGQFSFYDGQNQEGFVKLVGDFKSDPKPIEFIGIQQAETSEALSIFLRGEVGQTYSIEVSSDFNNWTEMETGVFTQETIEIQISTLGATKLFVRAVTY